MINPIITWSQENSNLNSPNQQTRYKRLIKKQNSISYTTEPSLMPKKASQASIRQLLVLTYVKWTSILSRPIELFLLF